MQPSPRDFDGNDIEKAYLKYFAAGDLETSWHGRRVRVALGTTHPAQLRLVAEAFGKYSKPMIYPAKKSDTHCWRIVCDLNRSFEFLFSKLDGLTSEELESEELFFSALAGFGDAEGCARLSKSGKNAYSEFQLSNRNRSILEDFQKGLEMHGIRAGLYGTRGKNGKIQWYMGAYGSQAMALLQRLNFRHQEKLKARDLILKSRNQCWKLLRPAYRSFREEIKAERDAFMHQACEAYSHRHEKKQRKMVQMRNRVLHVHDLEANGGSKLQIARIVGRSERTVYRWLSWYRYRDGYGSQ